MAKEFTVRQEHLKEVAQSLQEIKRLARSMESIAAALMPLVAEDQPTTSNILYNVRSQGDSIGRDVQSIYDAIVKEAMS